MEASRPLQAGRAANWLNVPVGSSALDLREAIRNFVERHQWEKLYKHTQRGNLNGLQNFLDIFRTLNGLLFTFHARSMEGSGAVIPFAYVTTLVMINLELLIGPFEFREDGYDGSGFVASIYANFDGDKALVRNRLRDLRVPQMLRAAIEAMVEVRSAARNLATPDAWATNRLRWVSEWIVRNGLDQPTPEDVRAARSEYLPKRKAA